MFNSYLARYAVVISCGAAVVSCDKPASDNAPSPTTNASSQPMNVASSASSSSEKTGAQAPAPSASVAAEKPVESVLVGTWEGRYDAKKGDVGMPPRVEDKVRNKDDGKMAIGAGTVTLTVRQDLEVNGSSEGALGKATIRGRVEGDEIRGSFDPVDVQDKQGMFGIISGKRNDSRIEAVIRVASGDATVVRESKIVLERKP